MIVSAVSAPGRQVGDVKRRWVAGMPASLAEVTAGQARAGERLTVDSAVWDALTALEQLTNPRVRDGIGDIALVSPGCTSSTSMSITPEAS